MEYSSSQGFFLLNDDTGYSNARENPFMWSINLTKVCLCTLVYLCPQCYLRYEVKKATTSYSHCPFKLSQSAWLSWHPPLRHRASHFTSTSMASYQSLIHVKWQPFNTLPWLSIEYQVKHKVSVLIFKVINGLGTGYLKKSPKAPGWRLWSTIPLLWLSGTFCCKGKTGVQETELPWGLVADLGTNSHRN